ncbi:MAG TPA: hypothetical protein VFU21_09625, partial [Kofleriaceae bacterium]|nr:hypothetical protein [Kofleriaceae bacterium]
AWRAAPQQERKRPAAQAARAACRLHWGPAMRIAGVLVLVFLVLAPDVADARGRTRRAGAVRAPRRAGGAAFRRPLPRVRLRTRAATHLAVLQRRTDRSIASVQAAIRDLAGRIDALERQNADKERLAGELVTAIEQRRGQLRQSRNAKGFFSVLGLLGSIATGGAGAPLFFGGMVLSARDGLRVADLESRLRALRDERAQLDRLLDSHRTLKRELEGDLDRLREAEAKVAGALASLAADLGRGRTLDVARRRLTHGRDLLGNLRAQVGVLVRIERSAAAVGLALDGHLASARQHLAHAEELVAESTRDYIDLVAVALSRSPAAAAGDLVDRLLVDRGAALLRDAGLGKESASLLARALVRRVRAEVDAEGRLVAALESRL